MKKEREKRPKGLEKKEEKEGGESLGTTVYYRKFKKGDKSMLIYVWIYTYMFLFRPKNIRPKVPLSRLN